MRQRNFFALVRQRFSVFESCAMTDLKNDLSGLLLRTEMLMDLEQSALFTFGNLVRIILKRSRDVFNGTLILIPTEA